VFCAAVQLGPKVLTPVASIETRWNSLALSSDQFKQLVKIGRFSGNIQWMHFFALGCSSLSEVRRRPLSRVRQVAPPCTPI